MKFVGFIVKDVIILKKQYISSTVLLWKQSVFFVLFQVNLLSKQIIAVEVEGYSSVHIRKPVKLNGQSIVVGRYFYNVLPKKHLAVVLITTLSLQADFIVAPLNIHSVFEILDALKG